MAHVDLKLRRGRRPLGDKDLQAWCAVLSAELNAVREALKLPPLTRQGLAAAVQAAKQGPQAKPETE